MFRERVPCSVNFFKQEFARVMTLFLNSYLLKDVFGYIFHDFGFCRGGLEEGDCFGPDLDFFDFLGEGGCTLSV